MRTFEFDHEGKTFKAIFRQGHIFYNQKEMTAYFGLEPGDAPAEITAAEAQELIPKPQLDRFREWHAAAQNALFTLIRTDNEID